MEYFTDFLDASMKIDIEDIYCTNFRHTIPTGTNFISHIKENIMNSELVIFLITENYINSKFCIAEMGAAWALNQKIYPIIVPPLNYDVLERTPLKGVQAIKLQSKEDIEKMYEELLSYGIAKKRHLNIFNKKVNQFLEEFNNFSLKFTSKEIVCTEEYCESKSKSKEVDHEYFKLDKKLYLEIKNIIPQDCINYFRNHVVDRYKNERLDFICNFIYRCKEDFEFEFIQDEVMEELKQNLCNTCSELHDMLVLKTIPSKIAEGENIIPYEWKYEKYDLYEKTIKDISNAIENIVESYGEFIKKGRLIYKV